MSQDHISASQGTVNLDNTQSSYRYGYGFSRYPTYSNPVTIDMGVTVDGGMGAAGAAVFSSNSWTVVNYGSVINATYGVQFTAKSTLINESGAVISSQNDGVKIDSGTVVNSGMIYGAGDGVRGTNGPLTVTNDGTISSYGNGLYLAFGGVVENAGTIIGTHGVAVDFAGAYHNTLLVDPGATFVGEVTANASGTNLLELGAGHGDFGQSTISGIGSQYVGFQSILIDPAAKWDIVSTTGDLAGIKLAGLSSFDTLDLTDIDAAGGSATLNSATDILTIMDSGGATLGTVQLAGHFGGDSFGVTTDGAGGTDVTISGPNSYINSTSGGVTLTSFFSNPVTVASDSTIQTGGTGIYASSDWTVDVEGMVSSTAGVGVSLNAGGAVTVGTVGYVRGHNAAIRESGAAGTVDNQGAIVADSGPGIRLDEGGTVTNAMVGKIVSRGNGVEFRGAAGTVDNSGYIYGRSSGVVVNNAGGYVHNRSGGVINAGSRGLDISYGATVVNDAGGTISGKFAGMFLRGGPNTVINAGTIYGRGNVGIYAYTGGTITNEAGGLISSHNNYGLYINGGTALLDNAGTISGGTDYDAVSLHGSTNRLVVHAGAEFDGAVMAKNGAANSIELTSGASNGVLTGFGSDGKYQHFHGVTIDSGASWDIAGTQSGINEGEFYGFHAGDRLHLTDFAFNATYTATASGNLLTITDNGGNIKEVAGLFGDFTGHTFNLLSDGDGGSYIEEDGVACYLRGTRVMTGEGPVAVENLKIGDMLVTTEGPMPLKWIGRRAYAGWLAFNNLEIQPVRFKAGSLADHVPCRDLLVSPEHAMFLDGVLIPARHLVNGTSIVKAAAMDEVQYFHLELERHAVIFAEYAASESFVDDDSRGMFNNADEFRALYPNARKAAGARYCAPRVEDGYALEAVRRVLAARAARLMPDGTASAPVLQGYLDSVSPVSVEGWAYDPATPGQPVMLAIILDGAVIGRVRADRHRQGLADAGFGDGCHAFCFDLPQGFSSGMAHRIEVRHESDWSHLTDSPMVLEPDMAVVSMVGTGRSASMAGSLPRHRRSYSPMPAMR